MILPRALRDRRHARWLAAARRGDAAAFVALYRELSRPVWAYVARRIERREEAEEVVAAIFHRFVGRLEMFDRRRGSVSSWLLAIAHRAVLDAYRARQPTVALDEAPPPLATEPGPLEALLADERQRRLAGVVAELPEDARRLLALRFEQDLGYRDIAALTGLNEGTVRQRVSRTLRQLRERLHPTSHEEKHHA